MSLEYQLERIDRPQDFSGPEALLNPMTDRVPIKVRFFHTSGLTIGAATSYVRQAGLFSVDLGSPTFGRRDSGWVSDLFVDYRLPRRLGILSLGAKNLFDKSMDFLETDPTSPRLVTGRLLFARARFEF